MKGNVWLLILFSGEFMFAALGPALLISAVSHTRQPAMMTAVFGVMIPFMVLGGFVFPVENMPPVIQALSYAIPLRYFLAPIRGFPLRCAGWAEL